MQFIILPGYETEILTQIYMLRFSSELRRVEHCNTDETWSLSSINSQLLWGEYPFNEGSGSLICILTGVRSKQLRVIAGGAVVP
jgi:hypothetical protein